jgi:RecA-family ATPase
MSLEAKRDKLFFGDIVDSNKQSQEGNNSLINDSIDYGTMPDYGEIPPIGEKSAPEKPQFKIVNIADVFSNPPKPQGYVWAGRIPFGAVTLLAAHGGIGKSLFALLLAICVAIGREFLGLPTASLKTVFFSAEDSVETLRRRVAAICQAEEIDPALVADNLILIDATDAAVLYEEVNVKSVKFVAAHENYPKLKTLIDDNAIKFAIIDNASDVYAADPVNRQYVTQFIRALVRLLPEDVEDKGVLLLAHVNRVTAKAGRHQQDTEGYADSAAWHNATRSRLFLNAIDDNGGLSLQHLKNNFGLKQPPLTIQFRNDGSSFYIPNTFNDDAKSVIKADTDRKNKFTILGLIREFYGRGEWISSESNSRSNAHAMLKHEPTYPFKDNRDEREKCITMLRECQREGLLIDELYKKASRENKRWALTDKADELLKWPSIVRDELGG